MSALRSFKIEANLPIGEKLSDYQVVNNTGGYVYEVDDKSRLERFLILGTDGGTYYVSEKDITKQNVDWLVKLIQSNPGLVLSTVLDVSVTGRAYRNDAAIFVLALMLNHAPDNFKQYVSSAAPKVARTATMVFDLATYIKNLGGWGRAKRQAVANWFLQQGPDALAFQAVKYRQRNGWTLRDLMRLSHPKGLDKNVGKFILGNYPGKMSDFVPVMPEIINGFTVMQRATTLKNVIGVLDSYPQLPWETIPTQFLTEKEVWKKLFYNNQLNGQALLRNITRLARVNAFDDMKFVGDVALKLTDLKMIEKTRLHPMQYLLASISYAEGQTGKGIGELRVKTWNTTPKILDALQAGFYAAFKNIVPANKRTMIGVDVSGSMGWGFVAGVNLTPAEGAAAMAMVTTRSEPYTSVLGFANTLRDLEISPGMSLEQIMRKTRGMTFGWTDPSLLVKNAQTKGIEVDTFIVITDNEVNHGTHVSSDLKNYRQKTGIDAKMVVMGMTATNFTIADPRDSGMMDVVGFDANTPKVIADFSAGRL